MILTVNKTNVESVSSDYPYSKTKDNSGANDGTPVNNELLNDYIQFFEKVFAESGLTANGFPDNAYTGFQLYEAARKVFKPYKSYAALITQTGTNDPVATVLNNDFSDVGTLVWTRDGVANYRVTLAGVFTSAKTQIFIQNGSTASYDAWGERATDDYVTLITTGDSRITNASIEIRVYD